ncbi:hypothetical protein ACSLGG_29440 (plasmid) [Bacillus mycoides]|uniref:hypothetical protein n=1 Tax=Bacillus mycoides TaxID=1405 RepID=UPI003F751625
MEKKQVLGLTVDVDANAATEQIKELTAATNECVEAFDRLEKKLNVFNVVNLNVYDEETVEKLNKMLGEKAAQNLVINAWLNGGQVKI